MDWKTSIAKTFEIFKPNGVIEVRNISDNATTSGYFKDRAKLTDIMIQCAKGTWYFVLNDISDGCYSRQQHEQILRANKNIKTTSDGDITRLRWVLIDADPIRTSGVSSTDDEKYAALLMVRKVFAYLRNLGFSDPVMCDSGNGYHLLYKVDMAVEKSVCIKDFLKALDMLFSNDVVSIDTAVFNPARITKLYGCMATKGADTPERPHRRSCIQWVPSEIKCTSVSLFEQVAALLPVEPQHVSFQSGKQFDIDDFIQRNGLQIHKDIVSNGIRKIVLENCPFDPSHKAPDSAIFVMPSGALAFKCFHNSCTNHDWKELREKFDGKKDYTSDFRQIGNYPLPRASAADEPEQSEHFLRLSDIETLDRSKIETIKTGITALDEKMLGVNKGELSIWSGGNGSGKSTILSQLLLQTASQGYSCALFSGELTNNRTKNWLMLQAAGRQYNQLSQNGVTYFTPKDIMSRIDEWAADKIWIYNNDYGLEVQNVLDDFQRHMDSHHTDMIVIDNLMSLDLSKIAGEKYDKQTAIVLALSTLAKKYNIHIHFVCHPRKPNGFLRKSDISGTADITNAADNVFMMHRINQDFISNGTAFFGEKTINSLSQYTNCIEIMKNRDLGVSDEFIGLYYEKESKRFLNDPHENICFGWQDDLTTGFSVIDDPELPFK